jgi:hypothetical protein
LNTKAEAFKFRNALLLSVAAFALALLAPALNPSSAFAVGGAAHLDEPATPSYTTIKVTGTVKEDVQRSGSACFQAVLDPSEFSDGPCGELFFNPGERVWKVRKEFTGLTPDTTYYLRIKAEFQGENKFSNVVTVKTLAVGKPKVLSIDDASSVSYRSAHASGSVEGVAGPDPAFESSCRFEYVSDVEFGARDEVQELTVRATGGSFQIYLFFSPTSSLPYDASAAEVQAALEAIAGAGNVSVSGGPGDAEGDNPYTITFGGTMAGTDVEQMFTDASALTEAGKAGADVATSVEGHAAEGFARAASVPCDVDPITTSGPTPVEADLTGLASDTTYHLRLSISNAAGVDSKVAASTFTTLAVDPPTVLGVDDADNVGQTQADVSGEVERPVGADPAFDVECRFEYVSAEQFAASGFQGAGSTPCAENPVGGAGGTPVSAHLSGLSVGVTYFFRLVATNGGGKDVVRATNPFTTSVPGAPTVSIDAVDTIGNHSAEFSGTIAPGGTDPGSNVSWRFECTPECPGLEGTIEAASSPAEVPVSVTATGLRANTDYEVTLVASNAAASASAGPVSFKTLADDPVVTTFPAFAIVGGTEAFVGGRVDPENAETDYWIEYGTDETYGSSFPAGEDGDAGAGEDEAFVKETLTGLVPGEEYHFRLVAENQAGTVAGNDQSFRTPTGDLGSSLGDVELPDDRTWEMVSPPDKNRADVWKIYGVAAPDGESIAFKSQGSFADLENAKGGTLADYKASRNPDGWETHGLTPPNGLLCFTCGALEYSEELTFGRFNWRELANETVDPNYPVDPNAVANVTRQYLRNTATGTLKRLPNGTFHSSADGSHYAVGTRENMTNQAPCDAIEEEDVFMDEPQIGCVYETEDLGNSYSLVSILPDDTIVQGSLFGVSRDGSHIYFSSGGKNYVRIDGEETVEVDGGGGTSLAAIEGRAGDGSRAILRSSESLVPADADGGDDFYVWDGSQAPGDRLTLITQGDITGVEASDPQLIGFETDRRWVHDLDGGFFSTENQILAGEPDLSGRKIYHWQIVGDGVEISYVASATLNDARSSENGKFLTFASNDRLTAYDNQGIQEVYLYEADDERLSCVSCNPEGKAPTAQGRLYFVSDTEAAFSTEHAFRNVTDNGKVFFESLEGLVKHDPNGEPDVYQYVDGLPHLLSKGTGPNQSRFFDASADGEDVFFVTHDRLVGWDTDRSYDIYNARINGGLPEPPPAGIPCEGDSCQPLPNPPNDPTPASENFKGAGNVAAPKKCGKGKVKRKGKCVKKKKHKKHKKKKKHGKKKSTGKNG